MDIDRQVFRPYGPTGPRIVYGLLTVEARRQADIYSAGPAPEKPAKKGKK